MREALKAEFRKMFTVRSTYVIIILSMLLVMLFAGYIEGFRSTLATVNNPSLLAGESKSAVLFVGLILALNGLLLFGHEYRYNTIMYTLTSSNKRLKTFIAKAISIVLVSLALGIFITFFSPLCTIIGVHLHGLKIAPQTFDYASILWRCIFCVFGYAMYAFILVAIIRSQIGAIVTYLLLPLIGENILAALLRNNAKYLPFTSLQTVANPSMLTGASAVQGAFISGLYIIVGLSVAAVLFVHRDAN